MNFIQLKYFCKAAELEHISKAAESLHITQPTLTSVIHRLEAELGVSLFHQAGRNVRLTDAGKKIHAQAKIVLRELDTLDQIVSACSEDKKKIVSIIAPPHVIKPEIFKQIEVIDPTILLQVSRMIDNDAMQKFSLGEIDLLIQNHSPANHGICSAILEPDEMVIAAPACIAFHQQGSLSMSELKDAQFASYPIHDALRAELEQLCCDAGFHPKVVLQATSATDLLQAVASGLCVAYLPCRMIPEHLPPSVQIYRIRDIHAPNDLRIYWHSTKTMKRACMIVRDIIVQYYQTNQPTSRGVLNPAQEGRGVTK